MFRESFIMALVVTVIAVFIIASGSPGPALAMTRQGCSDGYATCVNHCANSENCRDGCVDRFIACINFVETKNKKGGIDPGATGGTPPKKWQPPVNVGVNPPVEGGATSPPKHTIGVHPITPINPVNPVGVEPPGSSGSGTTTIYRSQRTGKH